MIWQTSVGKVEVFQGCFLRKKSKRVSSQRIQPFDHLTGVRNREYSTRCQKLMTDFGIEDSFYQAAERMREHHGIEVCVSAIRKTTEKHASQAFFYLDKLPILREKTDQMILEMDGEMVPLVEYEGEKDRRKSKHLLWSELRIGVAQNYDEINWFYGCSFKNPDDLGDRMQDVMKRLGFDENTQVHSVGDGAKWITEQGERIAGAHFHHLIDLPHLCTYLGEAATAWTEQVKLEVYRFKKKVLEEGINQVIQELKSTQLFYPTHEGLRKCIQYIENRSGQFEYKQAKTKGFPIGSGKIESTHRSLIQKRLKKPGTWWLRENAANMADLRTLRANGGWGRLWKKETLKQAA